ncbi:hypothetical protein [Paraburkholderia kururiensis]|uniref:Uncharacterized protein n=1 Tax=Paraburkholderia kururiensis TaxID=984307 RepID=A0ABZ0WKY6_9BURK|nr:hypothetical protein [Paraburkholderia kururiensis]WQD78008.1 hypothetical protein U0042_29005 [Paraburkholderia kururiensis]
MRTSHAAVLLALCLTPLVAHGDDPTSRAPANNAAVLKVFDAQGRYVGPLVAFDNEPVATVIEVNGAVIVVPLSRLYTDDQFSSTQYEWASSFFPSTYYPTSDCSGPPFISGDAPVRPAVTLRSGSVATTYIAADTPSSTLTLHSYGQPGSCSTLGSSPSVPPVITEEGWTPASTYPLTQNYPEPLTVHY